MVGALLLKKAQPLRLVNIAEQSRPCQKLEKPFDNSNNYKKLNRFADDEIKGILNYLLNNINTRIKQNLEEEEQIKREKERQEQLEAEKAEREKKLLKNAIKLIVIKRMESENAIGPKVFGSVLVGLVFSPLIMLIFKIEFIWAFFALFVFGFVVLLIAGNTGVSEDQIQNYAQSQLENMSIKERHEIYKQLGIID